MRKTYLQLNQYYPKNTYDKFARKEMHSLLLQFNTTYYSFFPHLLSEANEVVTDYYPKRHAKQHEVERVLELCKVQMVRRKDMMKIEEFLNLKYIIETQLDFYNDHLDKIKEARKVLEDESFSSFFPFLFKERKNTLNQMRLYYEEMTVKRQDENLQCEQRIEELLRKGPGFIGEASKLIGDIFTESMEKIKYTFKK